MANKIKITIEGSQDTTHFAALVTWALLKLNVRPNYTGPNRQAWNQLAFDEYTLSKETAAIVNKGDISFEIAEVVVAPTPVPVVVDPRDAEMEKMKQRMAQLEADLNQERMGKKLAEKDEPYDDGRTPPLPGEGR